MFFSLDGIDGVGKTTQMRLFCQWLHDGGRKVIVCRDPGSTALGERIRDMVLDKDHQLEIVRRSEMLLYMAARAQLVEEVIRPALAGGQIVVSDRYLLANICYQAYAGGLNVEDVRTVGAIATDQIMPDCVFLLDMEEKDTLSRLNRPLDRMEDQGADYRRRLRAGFLAEAAADPNRIHVIRAARPIEKVQDDIRRLAEPILGINK